MRALLIVLAASGFLTSCDASPTGPTSGGKPGDAVISGVQIVGPRDVAPGQTIQFSLVATLSDKTTRDVTSEATWTSGDGHLLSIDAPGRVTGRERGAVTIEAGFDRHRGRREVYVVPTGTYSLTGRLNDRRTPELPLAGARIEVTAGVGTGLVATTNAEGVFSLYGVTSEITLRATKGGYSQVTRSFTVVDHQWTTIELSLLAGHADLSGTYTLTIAAASECGIGLGDAKLPAEVRVRSYAATVQQDGPTLWVILSGPGFDVEYATGFYGYFAPDAVTFFLKNPDDGTPIAERLSTSKVFTIEGRAVITAHSAAGLMGVLSGELGLAETSPWKSIASCSSSSHQFALSR